MEMSEKIDELAAALSAAQAENSGAKKNSKNLYHHNKYPNIEAVIDAVKSGFANHGLAFSQVGDGANLWTILMHSSGQWIAGYFQMDEYLKQVKDKAGSVICTVKDIQTTCGAITYLRRYGLMSIAGIPAADDDGNTAAGIGSTWSEKTKPKKDTKKTQKTPWAKSKPKLNWSKWDKYTFGHKDAHRGDEVIKWAYGSKKEVGTQKQIDALCEAWNVFAPVKTDVICEFKKIRKTSLLKEAVQIHGKSKTNNE